MTLKTARMLIWVRIRKRSGIAGRGELITP